MRIASVNILKQRIHFKIFIQSFFIINRLSYKTINYNNWIFKLKFSLKNSIKTFIQIQIFFFAKNSKLNNYLGLRDHFILSSDIQVSGIICLLFDIELT